MEVSKHEEVARNHSMGSTVGLQLLADEDLWNGSFEVSRLLNFFLSFSHTLHRVPSPLGLRREAPYSNLPLQAPILSHRRCLFPPFVDPSGIHQTRSNQAPAPINIMETSCTIKTRFLIISDTHGKEFTEKNKPNQPVDVAIHCGDLTDESKTEEFKNTIQLLKDIDAPLKLAIAGNHDLTMDLPLFQRKVDEAETRSVGLELFKSVYGDPGEARTLFEDAGITFLDEGTHHFSLGNGASLTVYASPYTPRLGDWGFQFPRNQGHDFSMEKGVDVAITHGPPKGVLDNNAFGQRAGCPILFEAIARARPRIHCFGHVHEAWGAKLVTWRDLSEKPSYLTDVDNEKSTLIEGLSTLHKTKFDTPETQEMKSKKMRHYADGRSRPTSHCTGDPRPLEYGNQTLFVNAAIEGISDEHPVQLPWLVDIELSKS